MVVAEAEADDANADAAHHSSVRDQCSLSLTLLMISPPWRRCRRRYGAGRQAKVQATLLLLLPQIIIIISFSFTLNHEREIVTTHCNNTCSPVDVASVVLPLSVSQTHSAFFPLLSLPFPSSQPPPARKSATTSAVASTTTISTRHRRFWLAIFKGARPWRRRR